MEMTETGGYQSMEEGNAEDVRPVLVIGKSGNGKSSFCNALLQRDHFPVGNGTVPESKTAEFATAWQDGLKLKVVDTPDITRLDMTSDQMKAEVDRWREMTQPGPDVIILAIRCDVKYTAEEWALYKEISGLWGEGPLGRLVVVFTFGDCQDLLVEEELKTDCPELQSVLRDADWNYFMFDKNEEVSRKEALKRVVEVIQGEYSSLYHPPPTPRPSRFVVVLCVLIFLFAALCITSLVFQQLGAAVACAVAVVVLAVVMVLWLCCRRGKGERERLLPKEKGKE